MKTSSKSILFRSKKVIFSFLFTSVFTMAFSFNVQAAPDLSVRLWVDQQSIHHNTNGSWNFTLKGSVKNIGTSNYISKSSQQLLYLHEKGKANRIAKWRFNRLNRGQTKNVHVPVRNLPGGEFIPDYELALSFDPDIYLDKNPANDDRNKRNNQASIKGRTLSAAFARSSRSIIGSSSALSRRSFTSPITTTIPGLSANGRKPDLVPQIVNANQGTIKVKNIGNAKAKSSILSVICSVKTSSGGTKQCAAGLRIRSYNATKNQLNFKIPTLSPGRSFSIRLFSSTILPRKNGTYSMKIFADVKNKVNESNERNNYVKLTTVIKPSLLTFRPVVSSFGNKIKLDLLFQPNPLNGTIQIKNTGPGNVPGTKLRFNCRKNGYRGRARLKGCPKVLNSLSYDSAQGYYVLKVPPIRARQTIVVKFPGQHTAGAKYKKGLYYFKFDLDSSNIVDESNERNNHRNVDLTVH